MMRIQALPIKAPTTMGIWLITGLIVSILSPMALGEIYISRGPNGERMISDRPPHSSGSLRLVMKRDSIKDAGHILANRSVETGGPSQFLPYINSASSRFHIDPALVEAVIQVESGFDPNAVSKKGATGLMQLMLPTAQQYNVYDRFNPRQNINAGVEHLSSLMKQFNGQLPLVLAAYNAGATAVLRHKGVPPFPETQRYVEKVLHYRTQYRQSRYGNAD